MLYVISVALMLGLLAAWWFFARRPVLGNAVLSFARSMDTSHLYSVRRSASRRVAGVSRF